MLPEIALKKFDDAVNEVRRYAQHGRPGYVVDVLHAEYPRLVVRLQNPKGPPFVLRVTAFEWNARPASYQFVNPEDFSQPLPVDRWPGQPFLPEPDGRRLHRGPFRADNRLAVDLKSRHAPPTRPFICLRGTHEYHQDERHRKDVWYPLRNDVTYGINSMIITIQERIYKVQGGTDAAATT